MATHASNSTASPSNLDDPSVKSEQVQSMFDSIAARYDLGNSVLSMGIHHRWRKIFMDMIADRPHGRALDLCTGTGDLIFPLRRKFSQVVGADFSLNMLSEGKRAGKFGSEKELVPIVQGDALALPFVDESFDAVTVAFGVRNFSDRMRGLQEIYRTLKPDGEIAILEFGQPWLPGFRFVYNAYSRWIMPIIGGVISGNRQAYAYLPNTAKRFPCGDKFADLLREVGFSDVKHRSLTLGIAYIYVGRK